MFERTTHVAKPFLKWAGGKGKLLPQLEMALPQILYDNEFTYIEPFVGGGAMLFFILQHFPHIIRVVINDINPNLTATYQTIKEKPEELVSNLRTIEKHYNSLANQESQKAFFLEMRRHFNEGPLMQTEKSALLLFLNRTCFNGLYRENANGFFNVPFGKYARPTICNENLILADSELLNRYDVKITTGDYSQTKDEIADNELTFFYFDPPYRPLNDTSCFNNYAKEGFGDQQQIELAQFCRTISQCANVLWMLSNSDCSAYNSTDSFFEDIYDGYRIDRVWASRAINANPQKRGKLTELLISNFNIQDKCNSSPRQYKPLSISQSEHAYQRTV